MPSFQSSNVIQVFNHELHWHIRHFTGRSNLYEGLRGISVSVCKDPGHSKELIIDFPSNEYIIGKPSSAKEFEVRITGIVEEAITNGWNPDSRGKTKVWKVPKKT